MENFKRETCAAISASSCFSCFINWGNCNVPVLICVNLQICPFCTNQYINIFIILFLFFLFIIIQVIWALKDANIM